MEIASVSHMFPNSVNPHIGVFVKERLKHVALKSDLTMVAPVPSFPFSELTGKYAGLGRLPAQEMVDGMTVHHPRYFMIPKFFKILDACFYAKSLASFMEGMFSQTSFDILDFHWVYPDAIGGMQWVRNFRTKTVVTVRGNEAIYYFDKGPVRKMVQQRLKEFDHVIAVSTDLKDKMLADFGVEKSRISVIPNGVDIGKFRRTDRSVARRLCQLEEGHRYVLTVSRLSGEKGLEYLLRAVAKLYCPDAKLIIIGGGPMKARLVSLAAELDIEDRVRFLGVIGHADTCAWYNAADVFCLPSLWEGCPNVVIEALACGTPVVASRVGGIPDLIPGDEYGSLVPPGDPDLLALALDKALEKDWDRLSISAFGSKNSWADVADKVLTVFEEVLS